MVDHTNDGIPALQDPPKVGIPKILESLNVGIT